MPDREDRSDRDTRFAGYARAQVVFDALDGRRLVLRPAPGPGPYPLALSPVHVVTAYDPGARRPGAAANQRRQQALEAELAVPRKRALPVDVGGDDAADPVGEPVQDPLVSGPDRQRAGVVGQPPDLLQEQRELRELPGLALDVE